MRRPLLGEGYNIALVRGGQWIQFLKVGEVLSPGGAGHAG